MYKTILAVMLSYLLFTGQFLWFVVFGSMIGTSVLLKFDERMYKKRVQKRRWQ